MEDKELQQLFDAKRTTEANRRRQEELAAMIAGKSKRTRPLWPVWVGAAAACIAVLLITMPALFRSETVAPVQVAQTEVPEITIQPETTTEEVPTLRPKQKVAKKAETIETIETIERIETIDNIEHIETIETINSIESIHPTEPAPAPTRRVMRRTSTLLACTEGCSAPAGIKERPSNNIQIEFFCAQEYADATVYTFANNK